MPRRKKELINIEPPKGYDCIDLHITKAEAQALTKEFVNTWISHENELAKQTLDKIFKFAAEQ